MTQGRNWGAITAVVLAVFVILNVISFIWFPFLPWMEERKAGENTVKNQIDSEQAIQNYRWFRSQYFEIEAQRNQVENHRDELDRFYDTYGNNSSEWSRQIKIDHGRIQQRITGSQNELERLVAEYNARSSDASREMFKCHLPYQVDERFQISGPPGSGAPDQPQDEYVDGADPSKKPPKAQECDGLPDQINNNE